MSLFIGTPKPKRCWLCGAKFQKEIYWWRLSPGGGTAKRWDFYSRTEIRGEAVIALHKYCDRYFPDRVFPDYEIKFRNELANVR